MTIRRKLCVAALIGAATAGSLSAGGPAYSAEGPELLESVRNAPLVVRADAPDGLGGCGRKTVFRVDPVAPPKNAAAVRITRWVNFLPASRESFPVSGPFAVTMSSAVPAHLAVTGVYVDAAGREIDPPPRIGGWGDGVLIEPDRLPVGRPVPADLREFWAGELRKLAAVPVTATRTVIGETELWRCEDVEVPAANAIPVKGYLVMPKNAAPKSLPAVVCFHGAGFKSAVKHFEFGRAIVFDVNAHGIPNGRDAAFYRKLNLTPPPNRRIFSGRNDRNESYFKYMFLRTARAADFVRSLPEWDGKTLIVTGRSQGGAQALAAAALVPEVTLCVANVPAMADHGGAAVGRKPGWPILNPDSDPAVAAASDYVDTANLATLIRCEVLLTAGLIDRICPPASVWLVYRNIPHGNKRITLFPRLGHNAPPKEADGRERIISEIQL